MVVLVLLLAGAPPTFGQERERPLIPHFSEVRLRSPEFTGDAVLVAVGADSLELGLEGVPESIFVPIRTVSRIEYRRPATRRERATRGALWGSATLGLMGFLLTDRGEETTQLEAAFYSVLAGAVWGGAIGLGIRQSRWERVEWSDPVDGRASSHPVGG